MSVFPKDFLWSASTAATQIEGSWNADGKGESIWDTLVHDGTGKIAHSENADVAIDFYRRNSETVLDMMPRIWCILCATSSHRIKSRKCTRS